MEKKEKVDYEAELIREYEHWEYLRKFGGNDPFYDDATNMNLTRNHIIYAKRQLEELYGEDGFIVEEMRWMNSGIRINQPVEQLLGQFASRTGCEDIISFAEVFRFAKRSGGNFAKIIQNTVQRIADKMEVEREIETVLSGKKMEQKIMNIVPVCLLAYLNVTSKEFLAPLYGNLFGVCVMSLAFFAYIGAIMLAKRMMNIKL